MASDVAMAGQSTPLRKLLAPSIVAAVMFAALIYLGVWQLQRRVWKLDLLAQIDRAEAAPGIPLPANPQQFTKVRVTGHFAPGPQAFYGVEVRELPQAAQGNRIIAPLIQPGGEPVLIDRGWAPSDQPPPPAPAGEVTVEGYVRKPDAPGLFSPSDDLAARRFYTLDPTPIGAALGLHHVAPFTVVALGTVQPGVFPQPATALPRPPNDHLNYAMTWFALALALVIVFATFVRKAFHP